MSLTNDLEMAVKARPGLTPREAAQAVDHLADVPRVSALLGQSFQRGKLTRVQEGKAFRYYANAKTGMDQRNGGRAAAPKPAPKPRPAAKPATTPATTRTERAPPPKPTAAQQFRVVDPPRPKRPATPAGKTESVEEFRARGGIVQRLPDYHSGQPLRFDHSDTATPIGRRCPVTRARPYATHA